MKRIKVEKLDKIKREALNIIADSKRTINGDTGWHQHLGSNKIGIVATAMAMTYYKKFANKDCPEANRCIDFLLQSQMHDGGWPFVTNSQNRSNVIATCWAIRALKEYNADSECIEMAYDWLIRNKDHSQGDTGWSLFGNNKSQTFTTCFAVMTLIEIGIDKNDTNITSALTWLRNTVINDGSWADSIDKPYQSVFHTAYAAICLETVGIKTDIPLIDKALDWIETKVKSQKIESPCLECDLELMEDVIDDNNTRTPYFHFTLPYIALAFIKRNRFNKIVFDCMWLLTERNVNGYWPHPFIENKKIKPIWTLYDGILAIYEFEENMPQTTNIILRDTVYYKCFRNRICGIKRFSPIRIIDRFSNSLIKFIPMLLCLFIIFYAFNYFQNDIKACIGENHIMSITESFIASVLYTIVAAILKRTVNSPNND